MHQEWHATAAKAECEFDVGADVTRLSDRAEELKEVEAAMLLEHPITSGGVDGVGICNYRIHAHDRALASLRHHSQHIVPMRHRRDATAA